ncbi:hypothetical protein BT93_H3239 [Corymbia citriodora subsp. variegata]|nr:hypothetical protein BT93_H3239 [Corymbia citriodora subsp. variegata]KAF8018278.1 hypothetical protein BT93_H3239 [Corymbia citriodora subsp. variegata]
MPTFTSIALDRLLEPGAFRPVDKAVDTSRPAPNGKPPHPDPILESKLERCKSAPATERNIQLPRLTPSLYATPEVTPLPDSPSSLPSSSPYIINHKRRGPRLLKSFSMDSASSHHKVPDEEKSNGNMKDAETTCLASEEEVAVTSKFYKHIADRHVISVDESKVASCKDFKNRVLDAGTGSLSCQIVEDTVSAKPVALATEFEGNGENFCHPWDSFCHTGNTDAEENGATEYSLKFETPVVEFFDAWEELSSEGGVLCSRHDLEEELREIRLSLLMEIEKRKQTEEALANLQSQWQRIKHELSSMGLTLHACPDMACEQLDVDSLEDLSQRVFLARFVSNAIGRGIAKAEVELQVEAQVKEKNFEIARLLERLNYYETLNHEMSQRNQEAFEMARRLKQRRERRQRWIWRSIAGVVSLGTAVLLWSYLPTGQRSSTTSHSLATAQSNEAKR